MNIQAVLEKFDCPKRAGKGWKVRCPVHDDRVNSLSIAKADSGKILIKCQAGCDTKAVIEAVGLTFRDLAGESSTSEKQSPPKGRVVKEYIYTDEKRSPLFRSCRTESKEFFFQSFDADKKTWRNGLSGARRVVYHLPEVVRAETVYLVEGEKDVDNLQSIGITATTNPGGAIGDDREHNGKWPESFNPFFARKNVVILPDNDEPGRKHAATVARFIQDYARSIKIVALPDLPPGGDVSDYLQKCSKDDLLAAVEAAPLFTPDIDKQVQKNLWPEFLSAEQILQEPEEAIRYVWDECLPVAGSSILVAQPKIGKTTFAVNLALAIALGLPFLDRATQQCAVAYAYLDGPAREIKDAFKKMGMKATDPIFIHVGAAPADYVAWIVAQIEKHRVKFIIIDTFQKFFRIQNINDYSEVVNKSAPMLDAAAAKDVHVLFLHHAGKGDRADFDSAVGSTAIRGQVQSYLHLKILPNSTRRIFRTDQRNGQGNFDEVAIGFNHNGWLEIKGSRESAEIQDAKPKIRELLETEDVELTEKQIRAGVPMKSIIVSKALREMFRGDEMERSGEGKKGRPFRYQLASSLSVEIDQSRDSSPGGIIRGGTIQGHESENQTQPLKNIGKDSSPVESGHEWDTNGHESFLSKSGTRILASKGKRDDAKKKENENDGWEFIT